MMFVRKITENIKNLFGFKRKNEFSQSWKSELDGYGQAKKKKIKLPFDLENFFSQLANLRKKKSHISRTEKRKKISLKILKFAGAIVLIGATVAVLKRPAVNYASSLEFFKIKEIWVYGCSVCQVAEIKELANFDYNSSLFALNPGKAESQLIKHPWIKDAVVNRIWPDGISIEVQEHRAAALLVRGEIDNGKMFYINSKGGVIAQVKPGEEIDFPVITGLSSIEEDLQELALQEAAEFLKLIARNNPNLPAQAVSELHFDRVEGMVIRLVDFPFPIYFGRGDVKKKYKQLRNVLAVLYKKQKKNIDISQVEYIRMDYMNNKVLVAQSKSG